MSFATKTCDVCHSPYRTLENVGKYEMCVHCKRESNIFMDWQIPILLTQWVFRKRCELEQNLPKCPNQDCESENYETPCFDAEKNMVVLKCKECGRVWEHFLKKNTE